MTNQERLLAMLGFQPDVKALEAALIDVDVNPATAYAKGTYPGIRKAAISLMEILLTTPNLSNAQTGFSTTYDRGAVEKRLAILKSEAGTGERSRVRGFSW